VRFFLVRLPHETTPDGRPAILTVAEEHFQWIREQHQSGHVLISGPAADGSCGMILVRAPSREDAERIVASEPMVAAGHSQPEIIEWDVHQFMGFGPFTVAEVSKLWPPELRAQLEASSQQLGATS
jgi:uncharacterized protein YciI